MKYILEDVNAENCLEFGFGVEREAKFDIPIYCIDNTKWFY